MKNKDAPPKEKKVVAQPGQNSGARGVHSDSPTRLSDEAWEKMYKALCSYRFGHTDFLSLLDEWEEILGIKSSSTETAGISPGQAYELPSSETEKSQVRNQVIFIGPEGRQDA